MAKRSKPAVPSSPPSEQSAAGTLHPHQRDLSEGMSLEYTEVSWQGPLPPPHILKQINDVIPHGAERWMAQFETETRHRHLLERRRQTFPLTIQLAARVFALLFALALSWCRRPRN